MSKCVYCDEEEATEVIMNPNSDVEPATWDVCKGCKDTIAQQQKLSFGAILSEIEDDMSKEYGRNLMKEARDQIEKIAKRTKKPIFSACISRKEDGSYESSSIEFTGEE